MSNDVQEELRSSMEDEMDLFMPDLNNVGCGLLFNYYFSYLNQQIGSTNNILFEFHFHKSFDYQLFPLSIFVVFETLIEDIFLQDYPSTIEFNEMRSIQSNVLQFQIDRSTYRSNSVETKISYSLIGVNDFGYSIETIHIYQDEFDLNELNDIHVNDDIRQWQVEYQPSLDLLNEHIFEKRNDSTKKCYFLSKHNQPTIGNNGHQGVSTMKKTTQDCLNLYQQDPNNSETKENKKIDQIRIVPVYYLIMPSSCQFGPPDTITPTECDQILLTGTIKDPDEPNRIQLAYANNDVLRSPRMLRYDRYFRRTFYYVDEEDITKKITRYLFCAEYPYILSILDQLEQSGQMSLNEKQEEYLHFSRMLNRLLQLNHLSQSIRLIQYNDEQNDLITYADNQSLWKQIKDDIDRWYRTRDECLSSSFILSKIIDTDRTNQVILFYSEQTEQNPLIRTLIRDLQEKLTNRGYMVDDAHSDFNLINTNKQVIFIYTGSSNDRFNQLIVDVLRKKIRRCDGIFRDLFLFVNDAIEQFHCRFLRSIPSLQFDLQQRIPQFNNQEFEDLIHYLTNMNILSKTPKDYFDQMNQILTISPSQCTSIGAGCAAAFYFNYAKLLALLSDHQHRIETIDRQVREENQSRLVFKWIFLIPWTIDKTLEILSNAISATHNDPHVYGYQLSLWKETDSKLTVTVGGVYQRSYTALKIYKLVKVDNGKTFYFPMEIPAALHGLQNRYNDVLSHFHFGQFDPLEQATVFRDKLEEFFANDRDQTWHEHILLVPLDKPERIPPLNSNQIEQRNRILLQTLWQKLSSII